MEIDGTLIGDANLGTATFEAFFAEDSYTITGTTDGGGSIVTTGGDGNGNGHTTGRTSVTLTANPDNCSTFSHWVALDGDPIDNPNNPTLVVNPEESWADCSTHRYKAVFDTKKININAKSNDTNMGTVTLTITDAPAANQQ